MVKTKLIKISDAKPGMRVKSLDDQGNIVFKTITDVFETRVEKHEQVRVELENGTIVHCSVNHPFMVFQSGQMIQKYPLELSQDDRIYTERGFTRVLIVDVTQSNDETYVDITVDDTHTFFTKHNATADAVLTHNSQGGIRNASATVNFPIWHYQFDDLIVLKNNQGTEETRVRHLDYCVVMSKFFWKRFKEQGRITFFDPNAVPDLYEAFYTDSAKFEKLYVAYEKRSDLRTKSESAEVVIKDWLLKERGDTGRYYLLNIDNVMEQGPFDPSVHPIYQTNLCAEILQHTRPFQSIDDDSGRIALCTLGSINYGSFRNPEEMKRPLQVLHRSLHNLLQYQDFLSIHSELHNKEFEPIGVGVTNLAYWHAKRKLKYGEPEALAEIKRWIEHQAFYLTEASVNLAKEKGPCAMSSQTRYGKGVFPWELRAAGVNELTDFTPSEDLDWETLRSKMLEFGVRNATTMALPPVESSSVAINSTNGISMVKDLIISKGSKAGSFVQVVPEYRKLKNYYQLLWDQPDCIEYIKTMAVFQAYVDQGISTDTFYSGKFFPEGKIPATLIAKNLMLAAKWGIKSFYYDLRDKQATKEVLKDDAAIVEEAVEDEENCEACVL